MPTQSTSGENAKSGYPLSSSDGSAPEPLTGRQAVWAVLFALGMIVVVAITIRFTELVTGQYLSTSVPPLPAFGTLLILSVLRPVLRRHAPRLVPSRAQMLLIYSMMTIAVVLSGLYHVRAFLPHLVALQFWGRDESPLASQLAGYDKYLPSWYAPHDKEAVQWYYMGSPDKSVPWRVWMVPLAWWTVFFLGMFLGVFSFVTLVREQWMRHERLSFPLTALPLALTAKDWSAYGSLGSRRALFLIGFGLATIYSLFNILHAFYPPMPRIPFVLSLDPYFPDRPWTPLRNVRFYLELESIGFGYFVPLDVAFSVWFFYMLNRAVAVVGTAFGNDQPGFPFTQEQSAGGYLMFALFLLWRLRSPWMESLQRAFISSARKESSGTERWAWMGLIASATILLGFCHWSGFSLWLAIPYFATLALFVLVYSRIRAEAGIPAQFIYPWVLPKEVVLNFISFPRALAWGGTQSIVLFSSLAWFSTHHHPLEQAAYQMDSTKLAAEARIPYRMLFIALLLAFIVGLLASYWAHLSAYYAQGSNLIPSAGGIGENREAVARQEYQQMATRLTNPPPQDFARLMAVGAGFCAAGFLTWMRTLWHGSPFHPLGYLVANAFGDISVCWFPLFVAWLFKFLLLRYGGLTFYRRGMPFFLGLAIGHLFVGGIVWPFIGQFISKEAANSYHLLFGE
jgi:hypothetical protein